MCWQGPRCAASGYRRVFSATEESNAASIGLHKSSGFTIDHVDGKTIVWVRDVHHLRPPRAAAPVRIAAEVKAQFRRQWESLREAIEGCTDAAWTSGGPPAPARLVYHLLAGTEVYARSTPYEEYVARRRYGEDWRSMPVDRLARRDEALAQVRAMEESVALWLHQLSDKGLLSMNEGFEWAGSTKLGRALYLLRHTQNHLAELNSVLKGLGLPVGKWR